MSYDVKITEAPIGGMRAWCNANCREEWECVGVYAAELMTIDEYLEECRAYDLPCDVGTLVADGSLWRFENEAEGRRFKMRFETGAVFQRAISRL